MLTNVILSIFRVMPNSLFLQVIAPLFSSLTGVISIIILFLTAPYFSYVYGSITSGILFTRTGLSICFFLKMMFLMWNELLGFQFFEKSSSFMSIILEISPAFWIPSLMFGAFGMILFGLYAALLIFQFWRTVHSQMAKDATGHYAIEQTNGNVSENDPGMQQGANAETTSNHSTGKKKAQKKLTNMHRLAFRMQFLHISKEKKKEMAQFLCVTSERRSLKFPYTMYLEEFVFSMYFPQVSIFFSFF